MIHKKRLFGLLGLCGWLCMFVLRGQTMPHPYFHFKQLSIEKGLPTSIISLYDNQKGTLWIGTTQGVYKFNGENIQKYNLPPRLRQSSHYIHRLFGDSQERVWVVTAQGLSYYDVSTDSLQTLLRHNQPVQALVVTEKEGKLLIPMADTLLVYQPDLTLHRLIPLQSTRAYASKLEEYDALHYLIINRQGELLLLNKHNGQLSPAPFPGVRYANDLYRDSAGRYWISDYGQGVKCYSRDGKLLTSYHTQNSQLSNNLILDITEWDRAIWLATDGGGVNIIYPDTRDVQILSNTENRQFPANSVTCLCHSNNHLWIGMVREGVLGVEKGFITTYTKAGQNPASGLSDKCPLCLWEDTDGRIWIGTDGGGINCFDPQTEHFTHYPQTQGEKVVSLCPLSDTELLASSYSKGLFRFHKQTGQYVPFHLPHPEEDRYLHALGSPTNLRVNAQQEIEMYGSSAFLRYHPRNHQITPIRPGNPQIQGSWVYIGNFRSYPFFHDRQNVFQFNQETNTYEMISYQENSQLMTACVDPNGTLWTSDPNGITRTWLSSNRSEKLKLPDGNDIITSLVTDHEGTVWMGSLGVIYAYDPQKNHFVIYNEMDGILPNDFLPKPVLVTRDGNIYMGGTEGLVRINKALKPQTTPAPVRLSLQEVWLDGTLVPLPQTAGLQLSSDFSSLQVHAQLEGGNVFHKRIYRFRIKGLNKEYTETAQPHLVLHTIAPGDYRITVQCTQNDGNWSAESTLLTFTVLPPWWRQTGFLLACTAVLVLLVAYAIRRHDQRLKHKYQEKERQLYKEKVQALININHELRTPLTLIYSPLKQLAGERQVPYELRNKLSNIFRQARQMKDIIDMILNMRKMEVERNTLRMSSVTFNEWLQTILNDFRNEFHLRHIQLVFQPDPNIQSLYFDVAQCGLVINNLLSNAYKFSEANSTVSVTTRLEGNGSRVRVSVQDEGIGLQPEDIPRLFTRFYQGKHSIAGSGIGLSYAKLLVEMHGGIIGAQNNEGKGCTFFFTLPYRQEAADIQSTPQAYLNHTLNVTTDTPLLPQGQPGIATEKFHSILIVEDDRDLCSYLTCNLQAMFEEVYEAHDGMEALPILSSRLPQLVITDVKMPRMNGFELCRYIKQKPELNYIPVILLTSSLDDTGMKTSYKEGAEAYITKPFDMDLLCLQIQTMMHNHNIVKKHYAAIETPTPQPEPLSHVNEQLLIQLNRLIHEHLGNTDMDVTFLAKQMGMSRASLYNKTKGILETGINEYIVKCRIEHACRLLQGGDLSITEVSEQCGFKHPRNFSTLFKNMMGLSPTDYRKENRPPTDTN